MIILCQKKIFLFNMEKVNKEQETFLRKYNFMPVDYWPNDFWEPIDFFDLLLGNHYFRGKDYKGDSNCFATDCFLSMGCHHRNKNKFENLLANLEDVSKICIKAEFYELASNIGEVKERIVYALQWYNDMEEEAEEDMEISQVLSKLGIKRDEDDSLPF